MTWKRILSRINVVSSADAAAALARADMLFEGVTETDEAKRDAYARACRICAGRDHRVDDLVDARRQARGDGYAPRALPERALPEPGVPDPAGRGKPRAMHRREPHL